MKKEWYIVQYYCTGESKAVGYFSKPDAEIIMKHFGEYCDLKVIYHGNIYIIENGKLKKNEE